ncbi:MAG TPA: hypothetical protein VF384_00420 [Planctomycetota bacterium]
MSSRFLFPLVVPGLLVLSACGGDGDDTSATKGSPITVVVDGQTVRFEQTHAELQSFLGGAWMLDFSSGQGDGTDLSFCFFTDARTAGELSGRTLENDYREDNPDRYANDDIMNFVRVGKKEYQGFHVKGTIRNVSDKLIQIEIQGTFLEFARNWMETAEETAPQGREVQLTASIAVPLEVEASEPVATPPR